MPGLPALPPTTATATASPFPSSWNTPDMVGASPHRLPGKSSARRGRSGGSNDRSSSFVEVSPKRFARRQTRRRRTAEALAEAGRDFVVAWHCFQWFEGEADAGTFRADRKALVT